MFYNIGIHIKNDIEVFLFIIRGKPKRHTVKQSNQQATSDKRQATKNKSKQKMSNPGWFMESIYEQNEDAGYGSYDNDEEDFIYYENPCDVCEGGSYITQININNTNFYNDEYYDEEEDESDYQDDTNDF